MKVDIEKFVKDANAKVEVKDNEIVVRIPLDTVDDVKPKNTYVLPKDISMEVDDNYITFKYGDEKLSGIIELNPWDMTYYFFIEEESIKSGHRLIWNLMRKIFPSAIHLAKFYDPDADITPDVACPEFKDKEALIRWLDAIKPFLVLSARAVENKEMFNLPDVYDDFLDDFFKDFDTVDPFETSDEEDGWEDNNWEDEDDWEEDECDEEDDE